MNLRPRVGAPRQIKGVKRYEEVKKGVKRGETVVEKVRFEIVILIEEVRGDDADRDVDEQRDKKEPDPRFPLPVMVQPPPIALNQEVVR